MMELKVDDKDGDESAKGHHRNPIQTGKTSVPNSVSAPNR